MARPSVVRGASFSRSSACSVKPASRRNAGAHSRASQSVASHARFSSSRFPVAVFSTFQAYGLSICRDSSSRASFQVRRNEPITDETQGGWSVNLVVGERYEASSMMHIPLCGELCEPLAIRSAFRSMVFSERDVIVPPFFDRAQPFFRRPRQGSVPRCRGCGCGKCGPLPWRCQREEV